MAYLTQLTPQLWTGAALVNEADVDQLVGASITADVDLRQASGEFSLVHGRVEIGNAAELIEADPKIDYLHNPTADDGQPKPVSWFETSWDFVRPRLEDGGVVLCHCMEGKARGPSTAYFVLRAHYGMASSDAYGLIVSRRPIANVRYREDADHALSVLGLS